MWDMSEAVRYLDEHANFRSLGKCAAYTRKAIEAGGVLLKHQLYARDYGSSLREVGFRPLLLNSGPYQEGDVVIIEGCKGAPAGHMAMFDGSLWVSDFKQSELYPGPAYRNSKARYTVYRFDTPSNVPKLITGLRK
jgi:hypothetical protein